eukprot:82252-Chlamydomonas_euryale.AAC.8
MRAWWSGVQRGAVGRGAAGQGAARRGRVGEAKKRCWCGGGCMDSGRRVAASIYPPQPPPPPSPIRLILQLKTFPSSLEHVRRVQHRADRLRLSCLHARRAQRQPHHQRHEHQHDETGQRIPQRAHRRAQRPPDVRT